MRKFLLYVIVIFPVAALINIFFYQIDSYHTLTYMIGSILIVVFGIFYFVESFQLTEAPNLLQDPAFWICTSILFSYVCNFPLWSMMNLVSHLQPALVKKLIYIGVAVNILSYLIYIIAFLCRIKIRKSTL